MLSKETVLLCIDPKTKDIKRFEGKSVTHHIKLDGDEPITIGDIDGLLEYPDGWLGGDAA